MIIVQGSRAKLFLEGFLAYGAINALNKVVPLLMLPVVTRLLADTAEFGRFDMFNTLISFGSSFAILGMYDAMFREYFEEDNFEYKKKVTSTACSIVVISSVIVTTFLIVFNNFFSKVFLGNTQNGFLVIMAAIGVLFTANQSIIAAPTRIQNKRKTYVISGVSNAIIYYSLAIGLILLGLGYKGMIFANLIAALLILVFFLALNNSHFDFKLFDKDIAKELFRIGLPILPTFIIYWVFQSLDKIMITNMLDLSQVGIYSIGARVAAVSQFIYAAFAGGWQFFAFSTMKDTDQVELTSKVFEYLGIISCVAFLGATLFNNLIFQLVFEGDYVKGSIVFPYLFLSPLLLMLVRTAGNQFLIVKKSYLITLSLLFGVIANLALNYFLIQSYGIKGSALATLSGYFVATIAVVLMTVKMKLLYIRNRFILACIVTTITIVKIFVNDDIFSHVFALSGIFIILALYIKDLKFIKNMILKNKASM